jgi:curved DNA-binding protein CbpA
VDQRTDAYAVLGVPADADQATLKQAHRQLAWRHHPDRAPVDRRDDATRRIQEINVAYGLVRTPAARARYDAARAGAHDVARGATRGVASALSGEEWDELVRQAGRWAGKWWRRNERPLRRAAQRANRTYVRLTTTLMMAAYTWIGMVLALGAGRILQTNSLLPTIVGSAGGGLAGAAHRRDRLRMLDGHPPMRLPWAPVAAWLLALAASIACAAR